jgi:hypothetical protein
MPRDDLISRTLVSGTGALLVFIVGIYITRLFSWSISVNGELCKWLASGTVLSDCSGASITPFKMSGANVDVLTATATHLRSLLEKGTVSSADLVAQYLQSLESFSLRLPRSWIVNGLLVRCEVSFMESLLSSRLDSLAN